MIATILYSDEIHQIPLFTILAFSKGIITALFTILLKIVHLSLSFDMTRLELEKVGKRANSQAELRWVRVVGCKELSIRQL